MSVSIIDKFLSWRLVHRPDGLDSFVDMLKWWELRRVPYNVIVGAAGLVTCAIALGVAAVAEAKLNDALGMPHPVLAIAGVLLYGIAANFCYTGGWATEWLARKIWKERAGAFGQISFCLGIIFSVLLTLLPAVLLTGVLIVRLLLHDAPLGP